MSKRLLLIDDEPENLVLLEGHLAPLGYQFIRAGDAATALARCVELRPSLALVDPTMQGGLDFVRRVRAQPAAHYMPIVLVSARSDREQRLQGLRAGADDVLERPIDAPILRTRVRTLVEIKESRDAARRLHAVLTVRNAALERMRREQRDLITFVVNDLNVPASALSVSLDRARVRPAGPGELGAALDEAVDASRRLAAMIEDLLIVSRLEESRFPVRFEPTALSDLLAEVLREYGRRARDKHVLFVEPQNAAGDTRIRTDRALFQRIIENVLENSLRETPENGRVGVDMRLDDRVEIAVSNAGPDVVRPVAAPPPRAFSAPAPAPSPPMPVAPSGGASLSLYFCRRAMESLGGDIEVTATADWPTSVILRLPRSARAA